ncbi:MAG: hypothetical protein R3E12_06965 [Candidatus Eisenbacteria bacterium]
MAGVGSLYLVTRIAATKGRLEAVLVAVLASFSFLLLFYASEARGYACALFFSLLAYRYLERYFDQGRHRTRDVIAFGASVVLGILSQLIVVLFYLPAVGWALVRLVRTGPEARRTIARFLFAQLIPLLALVGLYLVDLRSMTVGSGEHFGWTAVVAQTVHALIGLPAIPWLGIVYAVALLAWLGAAVGWLARQRDDSWILLVGVLTAPVVALWIAHPAVVAPRYFIVAGGFFLLYSGLLWPGSRAGEELAVGSPPCF